jgi:hypothetical protein
MKNKKPIFGKLDEVETLKTMIKSCYTYGGAERDSWNYERYILPYKEKLGEKLFEKAYQEETERLSGFEIKHAVYTDGEGCTYNELVPKTI